MKKAIRVIIADDHPLVRKGLQMTFEAVKEDFLLVGEAGDGASALRLVEELQPDVILMDIRMPGIDGLEALEHIRATWPQIAVVMLTTYNDDELVWRGLQAGACGYLLKDCELDTLLDAIRTAARGDTLVQSGMITRLLHALPRPPTAPPPLRSAGPFELTEREREVLAGVARGERNKEIAARLGLTRRTIDTYVSNIFLKLGVDSRASAVAVAMARGLLPPQK
ncbi:MAG TPA: response regulator transcription factor [Ktedonobacterales bacterium]|nr:response regulator transcription factor [Ktedonobacterales bacterium]